MKNKNTMVDAAKRYRTTLTDILNRASMGQSTEQTFTLWLGDIADHIKLCDKIISGKITTNMRLYKALWNMDTDSCDRVPQYLWKFTDGI